MAKNPTEPDATGREVVGMLVMFLGVTGVLVVFALTLGWVPSALLGVAIIASIVGYRLATGESGSATETERDYEADGPGPLYVDPDDPESLIPRS